jgi:OOP family OmpA-OmpF porin
MQKKSLVIALSAALLAPMAALGQGLYLGGGIGDSELDEFGNSNTSLRLLGGYWFSDRFALELAYQDFGTFKKRAVRAEAESLSISALGALPINQQWSLFARAGLARTSTEVRAGGWRDSDDDFSLALGLGVSWLVAPQVELRADYELLHDVSFGSTDDSDIDTFGVSAVYRF